MFKKKFLITSLLAFLFLNLSLSFVSAQIQTDPFSGSSASSYQCIGENGQIDSSLTPYQESVNSGSFVCPVDRDGDGKNDRAILKPPALQQIEIWFVRIIYVIWALVGTYSFILLVYLGYQYMLRGGTTDTQLVELRKRIIYYAIGFALVFLAIPILTTIFRLLNINTDADCYNVNIPTFQFFFANLCTDSNSTVVETNPCSRTDASGLACPARGETSDICRIGNECLYYSCDGNLWVTHRLGAVQNGTCPTPQ